MDYPRSRGDDGPTAAFDMMKSRTIPARAGTTWHPQGETTPMRDHPRSRGDDAMAIIAASWLAGLSPLARGRLRADARQHGERRTIPARAGTTRTRSAAAPARADYPRSRGDDDLAAATSAAMAGLSPLARGRRVGDPCPAVRWGTIPARAGTTAVTLLLRSGSSDYPRSRGDDAS